MICPDCGSENVGVIDCVFNPETNEQYRKRRCRDCLYRFYTIEFEVEDTKQFEADWKANHRLVEVHAKRREQRRLAREKKKKKEN